jgi:hypothetical protein
MLLQTPSLEPLFHASGCFCAASAKTVSLDGLKAAGPAPVNYFYLVLSNHGISKALG